MKLMIWIGLTIGGLIGGAIGALFDHGDLLGVWSIMLSGVGSLFGVWAGYRMGRRYF